MSGLLRCVTLHLGPSNVRIGDRVAGSEVLEAAGGWVAITFRDVDLAVLSVSLTLK